MSNYNLHIRKHAKLEGDGPVLFVIVHNEQYMIPHFFTYYKKMGINKFVVYNDKSTDSTEQMLMEQENCVVLESDADFGDVVRIAPNGIPIRFGPFLKTKVPSLFASNTWSVIVDIDEFMILPPPYSSIHSLTNALDEIGQLYITSSMVDFYPESLEKRNYACELSPFMGSSYFDAGPYYDWEVNKREPNQLFRGIRARILQMLIDTAPKVVRDIYGNDHGYPAKSWKVPLIKNGQGVFLVNDHGLNIIPKQHIKSALAHFKFCPNLDKKIEWALSRKSYFNDSIEYKFLCAAIEQLDRVSLLSPVSRMYEGVASLAHAHLL